MEHVRFFVLFILVMSSIVVYVNRTNLNIAIVDMTIKHEYNVNISGCPVSPYNTTESTSLSTNIMLFKAIDETGSKGKKYEWDQSTQGTILGSFFYTYFLFQVPSGMLAERFGGKYVILFALIGSTLGSVLTPFIAHFHVSILCLTRAFMGMCQAGFFPASFGIACKWMPLKERSFAFAIIELGSNIGSVLTFYAAGYIINNWGWPLLFYVAAVAAGLMSIAHFFLVNNEPRNHPCMSPGEFAIIQDGQEEDQNTIKGKKIPWIGILTNKPVIAAITFKFSYIWMFSLFYLEMPKYLHEILHEDIVGNGQTNAIINILATMSLASTGYASDRIIERKWLGRTATRKTFALFNGFGYALVVALIPSIGCHIRKLKILLFTSAILQGFNAGSSIPIVSEMSQNFPSLLYAILNMVAMSTGFLVPYFVGRVLDTTDDQIRGWNIIFYASSSILAVATVFYLIFARAERQKFDEIDGERTSDTAI